MLRDQVSHARPRRDRVGRRGGREEPLAIRVGGQVARVDADVLPVLRKFHAQARHEASECRVEDRLVLAQLRREAVAGVHGGSCSRISRSTPLAIDADTLMRERGMHATGAGRVGGSGFNRVREYRPALLLWLRALVMHPDRGREHATRAENGSLLAF